MTSPKVDSSASPFRIRGEFSALCLYFLCKITQRSFKDHTPQIKTPYSSITRPHIARKNEINSLGKFRLFCSFFQSFKTDWWVRWSLIKRFPREIHHFDYNLWLQSLIRDYVRMMLLSLPKFSQILSLKWTARFTFRSAIDCNRL